MRAKNKYILNDSNSATLTSGYIYSVYARPLNSNLLTECYCHLLSSFVRDFKQLQITQEGTVRGERLEKNSCHRWRTRTMPEMHRLDTV